MSLRKRNYIIESSDSKGSVKHFIVVLISKITQQDKRSMKGRFYNPNALGLLLGAAEKVEKKVRKSLQSKEKEDLLQLKSAISREFSSDFSPANFVKKSIDKVIAGGPPPKITGKVGTRPYR